MPLTAWLGSIGDWLGRPAATREVNHRLVLSELLIGAQRIELVDPRQVQGLLEAAERHGVLGIVPGIGTVSGWTQSVRGLQARSMRSLRFSRRAVEALEAAGLKCVVLKGAAAAARWKEPAARQQSDLDLLVAPTDLRAGSKALIEAGVASREIMAGEHMHNAALKPKDKSGLLIELHHSLSSSHELNVDVAELLSRRIEVATAQGPLPALALEDDAAYLALHAATHAIERLAWLVDLQAIGRAGVDWMEAARRAQSWNAALPVEAAWREARALLAVPIPEAAFAQLGTSRAQRRVIAALYRATLGTAGEPHKWVARAYRVALVPPARWPRRVVHMINNRRETQAAQAT